jgi:hypothetical protein
VDLPFLLPLHYTASGVTRPIETVAAVHDEGEISILTTSEELGLSLRQQFTHHSEHELIQIAYLATFDWEPKGGGICSKPLGDPELGEVVVDFRAQCLYEHLRELNHLLMLQFTPEPVEVNGINEAVERLEALDSEGD